MTLGSGSQLGPYEIVALLGAGGMGEVYRAHDPRLGRDVALKLLPAAFASDPDRRARFDREARAAAALSHPNICTIHEIGDADGRLYIAMELLEGATLTDALAHGPAPMAITEVLDIGIQIADALNAAREKHLVHRDLKSGNIMLLPRGQVKVLDFGLAKRVAPDTAETATAQAGLTDAGSVIGTASYMSPEQALGKDVDHRSDLFSFGVVLYELLTGRLPFTGRTTTAVFDAILHQAPPPIPRFNDRAPDALVRVVGKLLEKDREQRYQSAHEVWTDLKRLRSEGASAPVAVRARPARVPRWVLWLLPAAAAVVAGVFGVTLWSHRESADTSVLVVPADVSGAPEFEFLREGVPGTLSDSAHLSAIGGLEVKVPPTIEEYDRIRRDAQQAARAYGAKTYVVTIVRAEADRLRVTLTLAETETRRIKWSRSYERPQNEYLAIMTEAADAIGAELRPGTLRAQASSRTAASSEEELAYRQGAFAYNRYNYGHIETDFATA